VDQRSPPLNGRILVVDDNVTNASLVCDLLTAAGYTAVRAITDSTAVVDTIEEWQPDLVLLDLHMPGTTGYDILAGLRSRLSGDTLLPVLVFTADWTMAARQRAFDLGAHDFITKPFELTELILRVRNFLRMRQMHLEIQERNQRLAESNEALLRSEQSARKLAAELEAANQELIGFTHSVSHDLRSPIRSVLATSRMLLEDCGPAMSKEHRGMLERQEWNASRLSTIIDELLRLSRVSRVEMKIGEVDLTRAAEDVAEEIMDTTERPTVRFDIARDMQAFGDPLLLRLVLSNLMGNAAKFSPGGGSVQVGQSIEDGRRVTFVKDEGVGFDMTHAGRLFEPFERLVRDEEFPGTGIGLANVKRIVERHGGTIWAESEPGKGACFYFVLGSDGAAED